MFQMINYSDKQKNQAKMVLEMKIEAMNPLIYLKMDHSDITNPAKRAAADVLKELGITLTRADKNLTNIQI